MGKIRTVKPELFRHLALFEEERQCHMLLRLAFIGLFTCCDREGRFRWEPRSLKLDILPYDDVDFEQILNVLWKAGFIKRYIWQNKHYGFIPSWHQHQCINKREPASKLPDPEKCTPDSFTVPIPKALQIETKKEVKHVQTFVTHIPISDPHVHTHASHDSASTSHDFEKHTTELEDVVPNTSLHALASENHILASATSISHIGLNEFVPAPHICASHQTAVKDALKFVETIKPVSVPIHPIFDPICSLKTSTMHPSPSNTHVRARVLHSAVHETHSDVSEMHVHASLEVEMEEEGEVEVEREMEMEAELELEREVDMEKNLGANRNIVGQVRRGLITFAHISTVFNHWKNAFQHPHAVFDKERRKLIYKALQLGYTVPQLCDAINGCAKTPHNMGDNERGERYDGLHIILGSSDQIERFMRNFHNPPRLSNPADKLLHANLAAGKNWLQRKKTEKPNDEKP